MEVERVHVIRGIKANVPRRFVFFLQQDKHLLAVLSWDHY